jgi:hypothetical protein
LGSSVKERRLTCPKDSFQLDRTIWISANQNHSSMHQW